MLQSITGFAHRLFLLQLYISTAVYTFGIFQHLLLDLSHNRWFSLSNEKKFKDDRLSREGVALVPGVTEGDFGLPFFQR